MKLGEYGTSLGGMLVYTRALKYDKLTWPAFDLDQPHPVLLATGRREGWRGHVSVKTGLHSAIESRHEAQLGKDESPMQADPSLATRKRCRGEMLTSWGARSYVCMDTVTRSFIASDHSNKAIYGDT